MNLVSVCNFRLHSFVKTGFEPKPVCVSDYALNELAGIQPVCLTWVPGHTGILGNERADQLA